MKQPVWPALGAAILFTCLATFFGNSLVRRLSIIASRQAMLKQQFEEWGRSSDGVALQSKMDEFHEYVTQRAAADAQRHLAALAARTTASLIEQVKEKITSEDGAVRRFQDRFEDEFGRRIELNNDEPRQYEVGVKPTMASDPLRYGQRLELWSEAALAVAAYNELVIKSQPDLDRYARELKAQERAIEEATVQWKNLSRQCEDLKSRIDAVVKQPRKELPSGDEISRRLQNSASVAIVFGISDAAACVSSVVLAIGIWLRTALIAGWFPASRILPE